MHRIKSVVVGLNFGCWVIENELLVDPGCKHIELSGVYDLDKEKTQKAAAVYQVKAYNSLEEILSDKTVEAIILMTGPKNRTDLVCEILAAGKHIMTTKPFALASDQAKAAFTLASTLGLVLHMNSPAPVLPPDLKQIKEWVEEYALGRPIGYSASTYCSYREKPDGSWYDDPVACPVAPIFRLGIYLIHDVSCFFSGVESVSTQSSRIFTQRPTPDNAQLSVLYNDGSMGNIFSSFCISDGQAYRCAMELHFEGGTCYRNIGPRTANKDNRINLKLATTQEGQPIVIEKELSGSGAGYRWDFFQKAILEPGTQAEIGLEHILSGIQIIELMQPVQDR